MSRKWGVSFQDALEWVEYVDKCKEVDLAYAMCSSEGPVIGNLWILPLQTEDVFLPFWAYREVLHVPGEPREVCSFAERGSYRIGRVVDLARQWGMFHSVLEYDENISIRRNVAAGRGLIGFLGQTGISGYFEVALRLSRREFRAVEVVYRWIDAKTGIAARGGARRSWGCWAAASVRYACDEPALRPPYPRPADGLFWKCEHLGGAGSEEQEW